MAGIIYVVVGLVGLLFAAISLLGGNIEET
jgi:hypothetical protein